MIDPTSPHDGAARSSSLLRRGTPAIQDLVVVTYMVILALLLWARAPAPASAPGMWQLVGWAVILPIAAFTARAVPAIPLAIRLNAYRVAVVAAVPWSYLLLGKVLPIVRPDSVDGALAAWDLRLFGVQPVLWFQRLNHRPIVEWMSFFYFNHYTLIAVNVIAIVWIVRSPRITAELGLGTLILFCVGQLGYLVVPAFGPTVHFHDAFAAPLDGGFFYRLMAGTVSNAGAAKDEFPSMHTGGSTWLAFFAIYQATRDRRFRLPAVINTFFAANIVCSTLVLRWHYAVDLIAGLALSATVIFITPRIVAWEADRRLRLGQGPVFPDT